MRVALITPEYPGCGPSFGIGSYVQRLAQELTAAGHAVLEQSDVLIAVWDGAPARGRGGTAAMVVEAWRRRVPVLHLSAHQDAAPTVLWAADEDAAQAPLDLDRLPDRPCDGDVLGRIVASRTPRR